MTTRDFLLLSKIKKLKSKSRLKRNQQNVVAPRIKMESIDMEITDTNINAHIMSCFKCDKIWRSVKATRCPSCAHAFGVPHLLTQLEHAQLLEAMDVFAKEYNKDEDDETVCLILTMEKHCPWYSSGNPWHSQACWMRLREYLFDNPRTHEIECAMEVFREIFVEQVVLVDEMGRIPRALQHPSS